ncbi:hypothetical protein [Methanobrevibacter sp.]|uniref:hypothetical protein n=1 Tax=Methanobrevibacter sp. TaxID=66852 RepID=UPI00388E59DD
MTDELMKQMIDTMKNAIPEKKIVEFYLGLENPDIKLKSIGKNEEIKSKFKNEFFDEIYVDENEIILDLRIFEEDPSQKELEEMSEYWDELQKHFKKIVQPCFVIRGKQ